jgi:hypothetical protein
MRLRRDVRAEIPAPDFFTRLRRTRYGMHWTALLEGAQRDSTSTPGTGLRPS